MNTCYQFQQYWTWSNASEMQYSYIVFQVYGIDPENISDTEFIVALIIVFIAVPAWWIGKHRDN